mgnify:CR=1 FL=1
MGLGKIITKEERSLDTLKDIVRIVYKVLRKTEKFMSIQYDYIEEILPHDIFFVTTQELETMFLTIRQRKGNTILPRPKALSASCRSAIRWNPAKGMTAARRTTTTGP